MNINTIQHGDALAFLQGLPDASVDAVITDPPYPEIDRDYGRMTEADWLAMMKPIVLEMRRVLKPSGSAMMVLQPNSEKVGKMRLWLWRFMVWCGENWNVVQDAYWWNYNTLPLGGSNKHGLMRQSCKWLVWLGAPDCYRNQAAVLEKPSARTVHDMESNAPGALRKQNANARNMHPSGIATHEARMNAYLRRGGTTPFNVHAVVPRDPVHDKGKTLQHPARTPYVLAQWWVRYISPPGGVVCDPFAGSGTIPLAARDEGRQYVGCDKELKYVEIARERLAQPYNLPLFGGAE